MATSITPPPPVKVSKDEAMALAQKELQAISTDNVVMMQLVMAFWDCVTHCAEPELYHETTEKLQEALDHEKKKSSPETLEKPVLSEYKPPSEREMDWEVLEVYQLKRSDDDTPIPDPEWPVAFQFVKGLTPDGKPYFQLFKSKIEASLIDTTDKIRTELAIPELREASHYVYRFNKRYHFGKSAYDSDGKLIHKEYSVESKLMFDFAEHALIGNQVDLQLSVSQSVDAKKHPLVLKNKKPLTYGQISALAGDFFGTFKPISSDSNFEEQCQRFQAAYDTLAKAAEGPTEVDKIEAILKPEMDKIGKITDQGTKTADTVDAYKQLEHSDKALSAENKGLDDATHLPGRPSYLALSQLNLDHFGQDAKTAYNVGHYLAMKAAKESTGDLTEAYAMNAFADHFLGDSFSAGHYRTPRRFLHGGERIQDVQTSIDLIVKIASATSKLELIKRVSGEMYHQTSHFGRAILQLAPDLCAKYMHDEENLLGLQVKNTRGDVWHMYGDSKLFTKDNLVNKNFMLDALKKSVGEVWTAFENKSKEVPRPGETNPSYAAYQAWDIAPSSLSPDLNHQPLFDTGGNRRSPWYQPSSKGIDTYYPLLGNLPYVWWAIEFASDGSYWDNLE